MIDELIGRLPREFVAQLLGTKLAEQGIEDEDLANAMADHLFVKGSGKFTWEGSGDSEINVKVTKSDIESVSNKLNAFLENDLEGAILRAASTLSQDIVSNLEEDWAQLSILRRADTWAFRERLKLRWGPSLDALRMLLEAFREIGVDYSSKLARSRAKKGIAKRRVLSLLHVRALQVSAEVVVLLEQGLADGAHARWRTLYEITVIAALINKFGDEIAVRYLAHDAIAMQRVVEVSLSAQTPGERPIFTKRKKAQIKRRHDEAVSKFGREFANSYGWAWEHVGQKNPTFQSLEKAAELQKLPPNYKWASFRVHAGSSGLLRNLGNFDGELGALAGPSNAGLDVPAINTAYSLTMMAALFLGSPNSADFLVSGGAFINIRKKVEDECKRAARKLKDDEHRLRRDVR